jgi:hypothetical protein
MCNRVMDVFVLWEYSLVATLHILVRLSKALIAKSFLIDVLYLSCYDIDFLVVVFVYG